MAERVGYSIKSWNYPVMFSATCANRGKGFWLNLYPDAKPKY
jgi:hypothetical protein